MTRRNRTLILLITLLSCGCIVLLARGNELAGSNPPLNGKGVTIERKLAGSSPPLNSPVPGGEGCLKCHDKIEPMHRYGPTIAGALDKLDNGKDGVGLTCTACHGGNPVATIKEEAHVQPRFAKEWMRGAK